MSINPQFTYDRQGRPLGVFLPMEEWNAIQHLIPRRRESLSADELSTLIEQLDERDARLAAGEDVSGIYASAEDDHQVPVEVQQEMLRRIEHGRQHPESYVPLEEAMKSLRIRQ